MVAYADYAKMQDSPDSDQRGRAARIAAQAYLTHDGSESEHAALYASLLGFLDDPSVRVRAALAYELLHSPKAPRPIMFALAQDAPIIARAVAQYSPVLLEADLLTLLRSGDPQMRLTIIDRANVSARLAQALVACEDRTIDRAIVQRRDVPVGAEDLMDLAGRWVDDAELRGLLLDREDLPPAARYLLTERIVGALGEIRMVRGSVQAKRLQRLLQEALDQATTRLVEDELADGSQQLIETLVDADRLSTRLMVHSLVAGRVVFFAAAVSLLAEMPASKVLAVLGDGRRHAVNAIFARCGFAPALRDVLGHLVIAAREIDLGEDVAARHAVVAGLIEELIGAYDGDIPAELRPAFNYLNEQNVVLARVAARGVMANFLEQAPGDHSMGAIRLRDHAAAALPAA